MLGFSPLASAPLADDGAVVVNVALTADSITTGAPKVGDVITWNDYASTASSLFNSVSETQTDVFSTNKQKTSYSAHTTRGAPDYATNLSVNSTGISFRLHSIYRYMGANDTGFTYTYYYNDITLNWSGTAMSVGSSSTSSSWPPSSTGRYTLTNDAGITEFIEAVDTAVSNANLGSTVYDWIPSEVTVETQGSYSNTLFLATTPQRVRVS
jgi:hypothetical protein